MDVRENISDEMHREVLRRFGYVERMSVQRMTEKVSELIVAGRSPVCMPFQWCISIFAKGID